MKLSRFFWKLFLGNAALLALALTTCVFLILSEFDGVYEQDVRDYLRSSASMLRAQWGDRLESAAPHELQEAVRRLSEEGFEHYRITLVAADGNVLADSAADPTTMESHADRSEIQQALREGVGTSTRWSTTVKKQMVYVALRVGDASHPDGVIRTAMPERAIGNREQSNRRLAWGMATTVVAAAALLAMGLAKLWTRPIGRIMAFARSLSRGDLKDRVEVIGSDEVALLARSLNHMRERLARQLETIDRQRRLLQSLVSQLGEGVIVSDRRGRVLLVNAEAKRLLQIDGQFTSDRTPPPTIEQTVPQPEIQRLLRATTDELDSAWESSSQLQPGTREVRLEVDGPSGSIGVLARATEIALPPGEGESTSESSEPTAGRLVVLTDVTELTRTIQIKSDFAANASHELRTPLAAIRAAIETLTSVDLRADEKQIAYFHDVIVRQTARMEEMVGDLLDLSRVESPAGAFKPDSLRTREVFEEMRTSFASTLAEKRIHFEADVSTGCETIRANRQLLRLVLTNLVDNAIRFTDVEGNIRLTAQSADGYMDITVTDTGCGIPVQDRERVFERFYQVERARSGTRRGTGLGLSIVKHAVAAMGGEVGLISEVGKGTQATIRLPQRQVR